jgi:hypothetical protein
MDEHAPPDLGKARAAVHFWAIGLLLLLFFFRLAFIFWLSSWNLVEDETHYWLWSERLDWSYYSKGPGIAYIIAAGTSLLGDTAGGVRLMAPVCALLLGVGVYLLVWRATRSALLALMATLALHLAPIVVALGHLMTVDGPYLACWAAACLLFYLGLEERRGWAWPAAGLALGAAFLVKYTALLLLPGLIAFLWLRRRARQPWHSAAFWGFPLALLIAMSPVLIWNAQNDWVTFRHLLGHAHVGGHDDVLNWKPWWWLEFLGTQLGAVGITLFPLTLIAILWTFRRPLPDDRSRAGRLFLLCCGLPVLLFYGLASLFIQTEGNWPVAAYVTLLPLAAWLVADRLGLTGPPVADAKIRRRYRTAWHWAIGYGLAGLVLTLRPDIVNAPIGLLNLVGIDVPYVFPHDRLIGAREFAADVDALGDRLGEEPLYIAGHYGRASQLSFYCEGQPDVLSASSRMQGRQAQHDYWPEMSLDRPAWRGCNAILVAEPTRKWQREEAFDEIIICEPSRVTRHGQAVVEWQLHIGVGYRGFPQRPGSTF